MNANNGMKLWRDVFGPVNEFRREFDRLFDDWLTPPTRSFRAESQFVPPCDVEEQDDHYLLTFEMAGVKRDDIKMEAIDSQIVISGERRDKTRRREDEQIYSERRYGKFQRRLALPAGVDLSQVQANYQDGILRVVIPKLETAKPRQIEITSDSGGSKFLGRFVKPIPKKLESKAEPPALNQSDPVAS